MKTTLSLLILFNSVWSLCQPNCNVFKINGDSLNYKACQLVIENEGKYYQFSSEYQEIMLEAIKICPYFAYPYREIAAPYVKSGNFIVWKKYIDKAVLYDRIGYLSVRASLRYKFFADYQGAISDIDSLDMLIDFDIGPTSNGTYHLNIAKALCYKGLAKKNEAIEIIKKQLSSDNHFLGIYDYLHLGVLLLETGNISEAIEALQQQEQFNNLSENNYYLGVCYEEIGKPELALKYFSKSLNLYNKGYRMHDPYSYLFDQIDISQIEEKLN